MPDEFEFDIEETIERFLDASRSYFAQELRVLPPGVRSDRRKAALLQGKWPRNRERRNAVAVARGRQYSGAPCMP